MQFCTRFEKCKPRLTYQYLQKDTNIDSIPAGDFTLLISFSRDLIVVKTNASGVEHHFDETLSFPRRHPSLYKTVCLADFRLWRDVVKYRIVSMAGSAGVRKSQGSVSCGAAHDTHLSTWRTGRGPEDRRRHSHHKPTLTMTTTTTTLPSHHNACAETLRSRSIHEKEYQGGNGNTEGGQLRYTLYK